METPDLKAKLSPAKLDILKMRLRGAAASSERLIAPRPASENPLSFGQERLLFQLQLQPDAAQYHISLLVELEGRLDVEALEASFNAFIARHEVLRTGFTIGDSGPRQTIALAVDFRIARVDLCDLPKEQRMAELARKAEREAQRRFDLSSPPLLRATLVATGADTHTLLITIHHLVWDGWSSVLLIQEIKQLYTSFLEGGAALAPEPLAVQYTDFAYWQRQMIEGDAGRRQIDHWRRRLAGLAPMSSLPTDYPRAATRARRAATCAWKIGHEKADALGALAQRHKTTLFVALLGVFQTLLLHVGERSDVAVGTTIAYRTQPEFEKLVGFFTNVLVIRMRFRDNPSFEALLSRVHDLTLEAQSNQDTPFERLVEELAPKRDLSYHPLFQIAFVLHNLPDEKLELPGLKLSVREAQADTAAFDLVLHISPKSQGLAARFEYDADLFAPETVAKIAGQFNLFLDTVLEDPSRPVKAFSLLDADAHAEVVATCEGRPAVVQGSVLLHELVGATARGDDAAVVVGASTITYGELRARSNRLARRLSSLGVGPEATVAVFIEPSVDLVVAIIAILKAGGAYVPLDPDYPDERIRFVLDDCGAKAVVVTGATSPKLPAHTAWVVLADDPLLNELEIDPPAPVVCEHNLAYVIYTSGSTGAPKGVMVTHRNAVASTLARRDFYRDRVGGYLLLSSIAFDSSVAGLFWTLADGGRLCIPTEAERRDPVALVRLIEWHSLTHLLGLPSLYAALAEVASPQACESLRCVIVAGEACASEVAAKHFDHLPHAALYNEYGPTESTVWCSVERLSRASGATKIGIGHPIPGAKIYCVNADGALIPLGSTGELRIGGEGVARGYLGRPDLTAERFLPDSFGDGARVFRTGDRGRYDAAGRIEFLGRLDDQIKLRGYRVEPLEVEAVLRRHPTLSDAVVIARENERGMLQLIAFAVARQGPALDETELKEHAARFLPGYMVPERIVALSQLPRLSNGKIDRGVLPALISPGAGPTASAQRPLTEVETLLAEIWQEVLGVSEIGPQDNFFDLGGNSLSAIQLIARVQKLLEVEISVTVVFDTANLEDFASEVGKFVEHSAPSERYQSLLNELETPSADSAKRREGGRNV
jgi:amino acid adenylation domain-containing protein